MSRSGGNPGSDTGPLRRWGATPERPLAPRGGSRRRWRAVPGLLAATALALGAAAAPATRTVGGVELTVAAEQALVDLQEQWLQWISAFYQDSPERSAQVVVDLLATAGQVGMSHLPDLSLGALAQAVEAAEGGDFDRAHWALTAAERLDPGRPETAFATATVARLEGRYATAVAASVRAWWRVAARPAERRLLLHAAALYALFVLVMSGVLFVAVEMVSRGRGLVDELAQLSGRSVPRAVALPLAVAVLVWPLALPHGVVWLALYWSVLLWGYGSTSERAVLVGLWLLFGLAPVVISEQRLRVEVALSPPARAMDSLVQGRLYGGLFTDLGVLWSLAPDSPPVLQLFADLQRRLGDWETARSLYRRVREVEPANSDVLLDLGAYYFFKRDYGTAIRYFRQATTAAPDSAAAYYNLSQAYSESYLFDDSRRALDQAQRLAPALVGQWVRDSATRRLQTFDRGFERADEIRDALLAARRSASRAPARLALARHGQGVLAAIVAVLAAVAVARGRRSLFGGRAPPNSDDPPGPWRRAMVPGLTSIEAGEGVRGLAALLLPAALLLLPWGGALGYRLPLGFDPGSAAPWLVCALGLAALVAVRLWLELREAV